MTHAGKAPGPNDLPYGVAAVLRRLVPGAEQDEVLTDLAARGVPVDRALTVVGRLSATSGLRLEGARKP